MYGAIALYVIKHVVLAKDSTHYAAVLASYILQITRPFANNLWYILTVNFVLLSNLTLIF